MKKKMMISILLMVVLISCKKKCEDVEGYLTADEESWIAPYSAGETFLFRSNDSLIDTFYVDNLSSNSNAGYMESEDPCEHHQQYKGWLLNDHHEFSFGLNVSHDNRWVHGGVTIGTLGDSFKLSGLSPQNNYVINNVTYNGIYIARMDTSGITSPTIWKIYYSKTEGILKFDVTGGYNWVKI